MTVPIWVVHIAGPVNNEGQHCVNCGEDLLYGSSVPEHMQLARHVNYRPGDTQFVRDPDAEVGADERMCR